MLVILSNYQSSLERRLHAASETFCRSPITFAISYRCSHNMLEKFQTKKKKRFLLKAREGDLEYVSKYLNRRPQDVDVTNSVGLSCLHLSARGGHTSLVSYLLHRGAEVNAFTKNGNTALAFASFEGHLEVVRELVKHGANVNFRLNEESFSPLYLACQEGHADVVEFLIQNGGDPDLSIKGGYKPRDVAVQRKQVQCLSKLLEHQGIEERIGPYPIHVAIKNGDQEALQVMLEEGFNVDEQSQLGFTALHYAIYFDNIPLVKYCLDQNADVNCQSRAGITALHVASIHGRKDILLLLLDKGAKMDLSTTEGLTALHCASIHGRTNEAIILLDHGDRIAPATKRGMTPLHFAVQRNHSECIEMLLDRKAPIDYLNEDGFAPLHVAAYFNRIAAAKLLLERQCNVNARGKNALSSFEVAKKLDHKEMVGLLLDFGAKPRYDVKYKILPTYHSTSNPALRSFTESQMLNQTLHSSKRTTNASTLPMKECLKQGKSESDVTFHTTTIDGQIATQSSATINDSIPLASLQALECESDLHSSFATSESMHSSSGAIFVKQNNLPFSPANIPQNVEIHITPSESQ